MKDPRCAFSVAFGGDGSFFARDCKFSFVHSLYRNSKWMVFPTVRELNFDGLSNRDSNAIKSVRGL